MTTYSAPSKVPGRVTFPDNPRRDAYWIEPAAIVATLVVFIIYSTWRAFMGDYYSTYAVTNHDPWHLAANLTRPGAIQPHYWSPFYSPYIPLGLKLGVWPISAALYVLIIPLSFRLTCYYCRKAYYRAIFQDPGACAVKEAFSRRNYTGETKLPTKLFNFHRYALYLILILVAFHWWHFYEAFHYRQDGVEHFGMGLGTLVIAADTLALSLYVFSCHSFRHLTGGSFDYFSRNKGRFSVWKRVSSLNINHGQFFWISLITVGLADLYVYLIASGAITDLRFF